jgi:uncharacterized protein YbaP (TraB family)
MFVSLRRVRDIAAILACLVVPCVSASAAPVGKQEARLEAPAQSPAAGCRGNDLLAEMRTNEPELHRGIKEEAAATENAGAVLWKVERDGRPASHLFGTVHVTDDRVLAVSPAVTAALAQSKAVALEVADLSAAANSAAMAKAAGLVMFTDGRRLDRMVSAEEYEKLKASLARAGMPSETAVLFRPWIAYLILSVPECERRKVRDGQLVLDMRLAEEAKARKIPVVGLETIEQQLAALAAVPEEQQLDMLRATLRFIDRSDDLMETMLQLYLRREMGAAWPLQRVLARKAGVADTTYSGLKKELVDDRNVRMRDAARPLLEEGGAFIAVGALHLPGDTGLVKLLREAGYTVTPVE